jgi:hypothetical protein
MSESKTDIIQQLRKDILQWEGYQAPSAGIALPLYFGNLYNELGWNGLKVFFNIIYKFDYFFRKPSIAYSVLFANGSGNSDYFKKMAETG